MEQIESEETEWPFVPEWDLDKQGNDQTGPKQEDSNPSSSVKTDAPGSSKKKHKRKKHKNRTKRNGPMDGILTADISSKNDSSVLEFKLPNQRMNISDSELSHCTVSTTDATAHNGVTHNVMNSADSPVKDRKKQHAEKKQTKMEDQHQAGRHKRQSISSDESFNLRNRDDIRTCDKISDSRGHAQDGGHAGGFNGHSYEQKPLKRKRKKKKHKSNDAEGQHKTNLNEEDSTVIHHRQDTNIEDVSSCVTEIDGKEKRKKRKKTKNTGDSILNSPVETKKAKYGKDESSSKPVKTQKKKHKSKNDVNITIEDASVSGIDRRKEKRQKTKTKKHAGVTIIKPQKTKKSKYGQHENNNDSGLSMNESVLEIPQNTEEQGQDEVLGAEAHRDVKDKNKNGRNQGQFENLRIGRWTMDEDQQLKQNMEKFCEEHDIDDKRKLLFPRDYEEEKTEIQALIKEFDFYEELGEGLNRAHASIYLRARKVFDWMHHKGEWTKAELKDLQRLHRIHGNNWAKIGKVMERSARSAADKWRVLKTEKVTGVWSKEEEHQLKTAVEELAGDERDQSYFNLPWTRIAEKVPTRTDNQCRQQWLKRGAQGSKTTDKVAWTSSESIRLIEKLYDSKITHESDIDWAELHANHFPSAASPQNLKLRWTNLKHRHILQPFLKSFEDILSEFHADVIPWMTEETSRDSQGRWQRKPSTVVPYRK